MKKFLLIVLSIIMLFGCVVCVGCGDDNNGQNKPQKQEVYTPEKLESNGVDLSEYRIIYSANALVSQQNAAKQLSDYIYKATGVRIDYVTDTAQEQEKEIVIGNTNRAICQNADFAVLKDDGYKLYVEGDKMLIAGNQRGALYGVFTFLEKLGYRFYTDTWEKIPDADDVFVPKTLNEQYVPQIEFRDVMYYSSLQAKTWNTKQKVNSGFARNNVSDEWGSAINYVDVLGRSGLVHTFKYLIPWSEKRAEQFASYYEGNEYALTNDHICDQPCLTSAENLEICINNVKTSLASNKIGKYLSISENDSSYRCKCANCLASYEEFGYSGTLLKFVNAVADAIKDDYPDIKVEHLVYSDHELPKGGIVPSDNVVIRISTDGCIFHKLGQCNEICSNYDDNWNVSAPVFAKTFEEWAKFGKPIMIWHYTLDYSEPAFYVPNIQNYQYNINYLAKGGACGIYCEGIGQRFGEFCELRCYLLAKLLWNPYMTEEEFNYHMNDFLEGYYGAGYEAIKEYMDYTIEMVGDNHFGDFGLLKYVYPVSQNYKENKIYIENCAELWDRVLNGATGDGDNKEESTLNHVIKSKLSFDLYKLYTTMEAEMTVADEGEQLTLMSECKDVYDGLVKYNITTLRNGEAFDPKTFFPDFSVSPWYWFVINTREWGHDNMPTSVD